MKDTAMGMVRAALRQTGFRLVREDGYRQRVEALVRELVGWHDLAEPPGVGDTPLRVELLAELASTPVSEALYLIRHLHRARAVPGDVCVFGVAEGATAALLANELRDTGRDLWLYDSFERLEGPSGADALVDDGLDVRRYDRPFGHNLREVRLRLDEVGFPPERAHIVAGSLDEEVTGARLPDQVCLALVDGDLHEPARIALDLLHGHLPAGAAVVVDGYSLFPTGVRSVVDAFVERHAGRYELRLPHRFAGQFVLLRRAW